MKTILSIVLAAVLFSSCAGWDGESKEQFHSSCMESVKASGKTEAEAKSTCDCRLELTMKKYPSVEEALENMDKIATDPEIQACK
jgi:hypothetical protein